MRLSSTVFAFAFATPFTLVACGSSGSSIKAATYLQETEYLEDSDEPIEATDCLNIEPAKDGAIRYSFAFHFPYDHMCEMRGTATLKNPGVWEDTSQDGCRLVISFDGKSWSVDDPDSSCRENWCGARGNIGHGFSVSKAQKLGKCGSP